MKYFLFDLEVITKGNAQTYNCSHVYGQGFDVKGENIQFKPGTTNFSHYALASLIPYIAAKQRSTQAEDWMYFESEIACPDPKCSAIFVIKRTHRSSYEYQ